jgi:hypothetical protein
VWAVVRAWTGAAVEIDVQVIEPEGSPALRREDDRFVVAVRPDVAPAPPAAAGPERREVVRDILGTLEGRT